MDYCTDSHRRGCEGFWLRCLCRCRSPLGLKDRVLFLPRLEFVWRNLSASPPSGCQDSEQAGFDRINASPLDCACSVGSCNAQIRFLVVISETLGLDCPLDRKREASGRSFVRSPRRPRPLAGRRAGSSRWPQPTHDDQPSAASSPVRLALALLAPLRSPPLPRPTNCPTRLEADPRVRRLDRRRMQEAQVEVRQGAVA